MYRLVFTDDAKKDLLQLQKKAPMAIKKSNALLEEIRKYPTTGTGQVEVLKHYKEKNMVQVHQ